ncbi:alpha/beta hydrolase-fold protein [Arthrobacter sp. TWP1-1]|uniref:alpha/beta hydrolase n=1 Tax=Arthrobacter sp. TWP1-1 TaxID=2804568 RepID=UPI003CF54E4E
MNELSLIDGPVPIISALMAGVAILFLLLRRSGTWWVFVLISAAGSTLLSIVACWAVIHVFYWWAEDLPATVVFYVALLVWAITLGSTTALAGLRRHQPNPALGQASRLRRSCGAVATLLVMVFVGVQVNASFGQYPTVGTLFVPPLQIAEAAPPRMQFAPGSQFMNTTLSARWTGGVELPNEGSVISVKIPGTDSGFHARNAIVYLPPAYSAPNRPVLPVLVLVSGQPGAPDSWLRSSDLVNTLNSYADVHGGVAPIVVIPDPNGSDAANTMCLNSSLGEVDTYMAKDVPAWIKGNLDVDANPAHWAVGGFSYGGTCAVQMVTRHPDVFTSFMAVSPEREPALAVDRSITIQRAFHGNAAAFDAQVPLTLLEEKKYPQVRGFFAAGAQDAQYSANVKILQTASRQAGMTIEAASYPGGHSWTVVNAALPHGLAFIFSGLGLP